MSLEQSNTKWLYALQIEFGLLSGYKAFRKIMFNPLRLPTTSINYQ